MMDAASCVCTQRHRATMSRMTRALKRRTRAWKDVHYARARARVWISARRLSSRSRDRAIATTTTTTTNGDASLRARD